MFTSITPKQIRKYMICDEIIDGKLLHGLDCKQNHSMKSLMGGTLSWSEDRQRLSNQRQSGQIRQSLWVLVLAWEVCPSDSSCCM